MKLAKPDVVAAEVRWRGVRDECFVFTRQGVLDSLKPLPAEPRKDGSPRFACHVPNCYKRSNTPLGILCHQVECHDDLVKARISLVRELAKQGSDSELAAFLGVSRKAAERMRRQAGISRRHTEGYYFSPTEKTRFLDRQVACLVQAVSNQPGITSGQLVEATNAYLVASGLKPVRYSRFFEIGREAARRGAVRRELRLGVKGRQGGTAAWFPGNVTAPVAEPVAA